MDKDCGGSAAMIAAHVLQHAASSRATARWESDAELYRHAAAATWVRHVFFAESASERISSSATAAAKVNG